MEDIPSMEDRRTVAALSVWFERCRNGSGEIDDTSREILEVLKCPVCVQYMVPPIPMCENGHNICNTCRTKVQHCPVCREKFLQSRCWLLENIIQKITYRCRYYKEGCTYLSTSQFIKEHEAECLDRPFNCPFSVVGTKNFCWSGHISRLWHHISSEHAAVTLVPLAEKFFFTVDCAGPGPLHLALYAMDATFIVVCRVISKDLYCCVLHVGPQDVARNYRYSITIKTRNDREHATMCLLTKSYLEDVESVFRNRDCAVFSYVLLNRLCVRSSEMTCVVEILGLPVPPVRVDS